MTSCSPNSPIAGPECVARRIQERTLAAASEVVLFPPNNTPALARLAEMRALELVLWEDFAKQSEYFTP